MEDHNYAIKVKKARTYYCWVPGCSNNNSDSSSSAALTLHTLPKNKKLRKSWIHKCRLGMKVTSSYRVCSAHFIATDYKNGSDKIFINSSILHNLHICIILYNSIYSKTSFNTCCTQYESSANKIEHASNWLGSRATCRPKITDEETRTTRYSFRMPPSAETWKTRFCFHKLPLTISINTHHLLRLHICLKKFFFNFILLLL